MRAQRNKKIAIISGSIAIVALIAGLVIGYFIFQASQTEDDPFTESTTSQQSDQDTSSETPVDESPLPEPESEAESPEPTPAPQLDPSTVSTVDIEPLGITVSYVKGVPGFSFIVLRTQDGTEYVEFRNDDLAGTICTDDEGAFASIIVGPSEQDVATLAQTVTVDETVYGLSLPSDDCTDNTELFEQYQQSFTDAFSLLTVLDS